MECFVTPAPAAAVPDQTEVAGSVPRPSGDPEQRSRRCNPQFRIQALRDAIERGEYHVSASDLADALVRPMRRSN